MNRTLMRRYAGPRGSGADATYIRSVEQRGRIPAITAFSLGFAPIGSSLKRNPLLAWCTFFVPSPRMLRRKLTLPPRQLGRIVKALLPRAQKTTRTRVFFRRRPNSFVFRVRAAPSSL